MATKSKIASKGEIMAKITKIAKKMACLKGENGLKWQKWQKMAKRLKMANSHAQLAIVRGHVQNLHKSSVNVNSCFIICRNGVIHE